ncbi:HEAT repeats [uncultured archaeon]|nr:HEAT repeats [uncultured archaeon]
MVLAEAGGGGKSVNLPAPVVIDEFYRRDYEHALELLESSNDSSRRHALDMLGSAAGGTYNPAFSDECVRLIGERLTGVGHTTTVRQSAASNLGRSRNPSALDYLDTALRASDAEKTGKYVTTVRANAAGAVALIRSAHTGSKDGVFERATGILEYVAEHDKYDPARIARQQLGIK